MQGDGAVWTHDDDLDVEVLTLTVNGVESRIGITAEALLTIGRDAAQASALARVTNDAAPH